MCLNLRDEAGSMISCSHERPQIVGAQDIFSSSASLSQQSVDPLRMTGLLCTAVEDIPQRRWKEGSIRFDVFLSVTLSLQTHTVSSPALDLSPSGGMVCN